MDSMRSRKDHTTRIERKRETDDGKRYGTTEFLELIKRWFTEINMISGT